TFIIIATFYYTLSVIVRQKKISEMKNDFVNNMTHELKTPIATISLAAQMMCDNNIPTDSKNFESMGDIISKESKRLGLQVEKVLQMATLENGEIKLKKKEINVHSTIENIVRSNRMLVEQSGGVIKTCLKADYCTIKADEIHFVNIITNLLENAIKYSKENLVITLSTKNNDRGVYISISDNGIGIKKDDQKHIFDQFFRVHTGNRHDVKGFGLGLSYVKKIIDLHDANISVDSKIGEGTTFVIFFPFINKQ
ncbi:MAG: HAMP domain-containing histidine kinase, partial [Bacteroidales bacterium]|nr:HAMP domain-containing histidine kinase [Bacteroidales bacterium]